METITFRRNGFNIAALLLLLPAAWFFGINILNELGVHGPYNASEPLLENWGISEKFGWNINLLIVLGPVLALLIAAWQTLHIQWLFSKEQFQFNITIRKKWFPLLIGFLSAFLSAGLFFYLLGENL